MKRSNNKKSSSSQKRGGSLAKSPKSPWRKKQRGPSCSREPDNNENPRNTKDAPKKEKQPTGVKNKGEGEGKGRKRNQNIQVKLIILYLTFDTKDQVKTFWTYHNSVRIPLEFSLQ